MAFPVVYDVLMRVEIEARDPAEALKTIAEDISIYGIEKAVKSAYEIIRDDDSFPPKDNHSRHVNGFAIFTGTQKLDLLAKIADALESASKGNKAPGDVLLAALTKELGYLDNRELDGVQL